MNRTTKECWLELCAEAAICEDPCRLARLAAEITTILQEEQLRLEAQDAKVQGAA
jgi:hypothetical protein